MQLESLQYGAFTLQSQLVETADQEQIALFRLTQDGAELAGRTPVLLLHGSYSNRHFWLSPKGVGIAGYLFEQGLDVWIIEFRGHGLAPRSENFKQFSAQDWGQYDLPAAQQVIAAATNKKPFLLGHSAGGVNMLLGLSAGFLGPADVAGIVLMGVQTTHGHEYLRNPLIYYTLQAVMAVLGYFPAQRFNLGPEDEAPAFVTQMVGWRRSGRWLTKEGKDVWDGLKSLSLPVLLITSDGDTQDPKAGVEQLYQHLQSEDKTFVCLGTAQGFSQDYTHPGMVVDKQARTEVWPLVNDWLQERK